MKVYFKLTKNAKAATEKNTMVKNTISPLSKLTEAVLKTAWDLVSTKKLEGIMSDSVL